ncbi:MAG TPA: hypothetical protein ENH94_04860 [Phycisphaerales bacterium]|nr:hypothetical protein [Phycisphaerales bacterium]
MGKEKVEIDSVDVLENVNDVQGLLDAVGKMVGDFHGEKGEYPTQLKVPDNHWYLLEMALHECFHTLSKKKREKIIKRGFDGSGITLFGLKLYGTIRVPHVR